MFKQRFKQRMGAPKVANRITYRYYRDIIFYQRDIIFYQIIEIDDSTEGGDWWTVNFPMEKRRGVPRPQVAASGLGSVDLPLWFTVA